MSTLIRVGVIDDQRATSSGVLWELGRRISLRDDCVAATSIAEVVAAGGDFDVVVLDVNLPDPAEPAENVRRLVAEGWPVVLYTQEWRPAILGPCLREGAKGLIIKSDTVDDLVDAVTVACAGETYMNADWASVVQAFSDGMVPSLSPREVEVLRLLVAGLPQKSVARRLNISPDTTKEHLKRIKAKYDDAGRPVRSMPDLYRRAVEDGHMPSPTDR